MSNESKVNISYSKKYANLFRLFNPEFAPEVDTVIMTGGRGSGKSHPVALFSTIGLVQHQWSILYTRYTNMSISDSVKPEVSSKIEMLGISQYVRDTENAVFYGKNKISFKGIKTGSSQQTANLKGLNIFNVFVCDEAEELPDLETFKKIFYSIRSGQKRNVNILILNPTTKNHWIYKEFFEKRNIPDGFNGIKDNVIYIHTSYLDLPPNTLPDNIIRDYQRMKVEEPKLYDNIVLGGWIEDLEGVLLPRNELNFSKIDIDAPNIVYRLAVGDPADTGGDKFSCVFIDVCAVGNSLRFYVRDVTHNTFGIEANIEVINRRLNENLTNHIIIEKNGVGVAAVLGLKKVINENKILTSYHSTIPKEVRIRSNYELVKRLFVFREDYKEDAQYNAFINDLCNYKDIDDTRTNKHRVDAIDVCCAAVNILKAKYRGLC